GWKYTNRIVAHYDGPMDAVTYAPSTVTEKVRALHGEMAGHLVEPDDIRAFTAALRTQLQNIPRAEKQRTKGHLSADVATALAVQDARVALLPMVEDFRERNGATRSSTSPNGPSWPPGSPNSSLRSAKRSVRPSRWSCSTSIRTPVTPNL